MVCCLQSWLSTKTLRFWTATDPCFWGSLQNGFRNSTKSPEGVSALELAVSSNYRFRILWNGPHGTFVIAVYPQGLQGPPVLRNSDFKDCAQYLGLRQSSRIKRGMKSKLCYYRFLGVWASGSSGFT